MSSRMENIGHGWVRPRADGAKAKCGGPGICRECQREKADLDKMAELERVCWACQEVYTGPLGVSGKCPTCEAGGQPDPALDVPASQWRCFHCDEVFTDRAAAADHFGVQIDGCADDVACKLNATDGLLVKMLREAQEELRQYHQEDNAAFRQFYSLGADHAVALRREEERGYARGLEDAKKHPETLGLARVAT